MVPAFVVPLLVSRRAGGKSIPRRAVVVLSLLGALLTLAFLIQTVNTAQSDLGFGGPVVFFTFLAWARLEWRAYPVEREYRVGAGQSQA